MVLQRHNLLDYKYLIQGTNGISTKYRYVVYGIMGVSYLYRLPLPTIGYLGYSKVHVRVIAQLAGCFNT